MIVDSDNAHYIIIILVIIVIIYCNAWHRQISTDTDNRWSAVIICSVCRNTRWIIYIENQAKFLSLFLPHKIYRILQTLIFPYESILISDWSACDLLPSDWSIYFYFQHNKRSISRLIHFRSRSKEICDWEKKDLGCDKASSILFKDTTLNERNCFSSPDIVQQQAADMTMAASSVVLSNNTLEKAAKAKATIENYYTNLINQHRERRER